MILKYRKMITNKILQLELIKVILIPQIKINNNNKRISKDMKKNLA